jgi:3-phosphoglycerate kinase
MNYNKKTIEDVNVQGKRVLVRVDFNVPLDANKKITDENRIIGALPTIKYLIKNGAKVVLCSHLGRPKGQFNDKYSLAPVAARLSELLGKEVKMCKDVIGEDADRVTASLKDGEVCLLENLRFHKEEEANDPEFAKKLASYADLFVNDAFGTAHRAHASTEGVTHYLPSVAGYLIEKELKVMGGALADPARPFLAILGGAKVSDKIEVINNLLTKVNVLIIGGGMAYTFQKAMGGRIGNSLCEDDKMDLAKEILAKAAYKGVRIVLPVDNEAGDRFANDCLHITVHSQEIPDGFEGLDIGPVTRELFVNEIRRAKTIVWNGPVGVFEIQTFAKGTLQIAEDLAEATQQGAYTLVGGGDSVAAVTQMGYADKVSYVSTGGGAMLEALEGKDLPGIAAIRG